MMNRVGLSTLLFLVAASAAPANHPLTLLFGPTSETAGQPAAKAVAGAIIEWLNVPGSTVELLRTNIRDSQELVKYQRPSEIESALLDAARAGRESDMMQFVNALDRAAYAAARRPGERVLLVVVDSPSPALAATVKGGPEEFDSRLAQTLEFCKSKSIKVVVFDPSDASKDSAPALKSLASGTGGVLVREAATVNAAMSKAGALEQARAEAEAPKPAAGPPGLLARTKFFRTYPGRARGGSNLSAMTGLLLVEAPIDGLEFETDRSDYLARARVTQVVRNKEGKIVWEAKKEFTLKGPPRKLEARKGGYLCYMRELKMPAAHYALEATIEDLVSGKSAQATEALHATDSIPGLTLSDAVFVRKYDSSVDKIEGDQVLSYDGTAIIPLLDPVFQAGQPSSLQVYFVIYPDYRGAPPRIDLEFRRDGQPIGRSELPFGDRIRNTAGEGQGMDKGSVTEQKHEFPYLAEIRDLIFEPGPHEAHITVTQGGNGVTRIVPFTVRDDTKEVRIAPRAGRLD